MGFCRLSETHLTMASFVLTLSLVFLSIALSAAVEIVANKVTPEQAGAILGKHNYLRSLISQGKVSGQPKSTDVRDLAWDNKLAEEAQKIANTLKYGHVKVTDPRWSVGQNIAQRQSSEKLTSPDWDGILQSWFDEYKDFKYPNGRTPGKDVGHYTQMVWADTKYLGCGYTSWVENDGRMPAKDLYVCNYGPAGNVGDNPPYRTD